MLRVPPLLPFLVLLACGDGPAERIHPRAAGTSEVLKAEMDSAKEHLRLGEVDKAEALGWTVYRQAKADPALAKQRIHALTLLGRVMQRRLLNDSALSLYREGLDIALATADTSAIGTMWVNIGVALEDKERYTEALEAQLNALRWKELAGDERNLPRVLHNLGVLYWRQDSTEQALRLIERSVALKRVYEPGNVAVGLNGVGLLLMELGRLDTALTVLRASLALEDSLDQGAGRQVQLSNIALCFERMGRLDSAVHHYTAALEAARAHDDQYVAVQCLYGLGEVRRMQGRPAEALPLLDSSLALARRLHSLEDLRESHFSLSKLHEQQGRAAAALAHYKAYHQLSDSLMNADKEATMNELRLRYATEKKDRENKELRSGQELAELRAERNRWIAVGTGVLALAGAVLAWAVVQRNRQHARQREAELEQQALRLQMDPHFLFNALNTIPGLYASGDAALANDHVGHLSKYLRLVLETSRRRTVPLAQEIALVEHYLQVSANRRPGRFTWSLKVQPWVRTERVAVPPMLVQPLVENALEHAFPTGRTGHIHVLIDQAGSVLHIEVSDNGVGRAAAAQRPSRTGGTSLGLDLVRRRVQLFDAHSNLSDTVLVTDLHAPDGSPAGTTITLRMRTSTLDEHASAGDRG